MLMHASTRPIHSKKEATMQDRTRSFNGTTLAHLPYGSIVRCMRAGLQRVALHHLRPGDEIGSTS
jgi:hypothetical protein